MNLWFVRVHGYTVLKAFSDLEIFPVTARKKVLGIARKNNSPKFLAIIDSMICNVQKFITSLLQNKNLEMLLAIPW